MFGTHNGSLSSQKHLNQLKHYDETMKRVHGCKLELKKTSSETTLCLAKDNHQASTNYVKLHVKAVNECTIYCQTGITVYYLYIYCFIFYVFTFRTYRTQSNSNMLLKYLNVRWMIKNTWTFLVAFESTIQMLSNFHNRCPHEICICLPSFVTIYQYITKL